MRHRNVLPISLLVLTLAAPALVADPGLGAAALAEKGDKDKSKQSKQYDKAQSKDRGPQNIPPGHLPPPGRCRVWYDGRPPGQQPAVTDCATARREAARNGGRVIYGDNSRDDDRWDNDDRWDRLDRNDDGYVSRSEWTGDTRLFDRLDQNHDRRLSRSEVRTWDFDRDDDGSNEEVRFRDMDGNRDGRLSSTEWRGNRTDFNRLDRNDDGYVSLTEWLRPS
ncbi:MAG TPA: hypothetical protein VMW27_30620 [Thermoanaerobaculia bacterium]|nr:hypothetical protein [Thermoanaerobaculia bacterium]